MSEPPAVRIAPAVRAQLDELQPDLLGIPVRTVPGMADQMRFLTRRVLDAEAAGMELGPFEYEHERTPDGWVYRVTAEFRPRGTVTP